MLAVAAVLAAPAPALAVGRAGDADPTFNGGTAATADLAATSPRTTFFRDVLVDAAGRLLAGGSTSDGDGRTALAIARFGADGARDDTFGTQGAFVRQLGSGTNIYSMSSGLFAVPGRYAGAAAYRITGAGRGTQSAFLVRADGTADLDVGSGGLFTQDPATPPGYANTSAGVAGPDGSVYVTGVLEGTPMSGANRKLAVTKFTPQGLAAPGWGTNNGTWIGHFSQAADTGTYGNALLTVGTNKLLVAGVALLPTGRFGALVSRFSTVDGTPDASFGTAPGRTVVNASDPGAGSGADSQITALASGPDGEIYAAGTADDAAGEQSVLVMRLTTAGSPDGTFGVGGVKRIQLGSTGERSAAQDIVVQPDGKVVVSAGVYSSGGGGDSGARLVRLLDDGTLDPSFGQNGVTTPMAGATQLSASGLAISGNRILVAGSVKDGTKYYGAVGAYLLAPLPDPPPVVPGPVPGPTVPGPAPGGAPTPGTPGGVPAKAGVASFKGARLKVDRKGRLKVTVSCSALGPCSGRVVLFAATGTPALQSGAKKKGAAAVYVQRRYAVKASRKATMTLKVTRSVRTKARAGRGLKARLALVPTTGKAKTSKVRLVR